MTMFTGTGTGTVDASANTWKFRNEATRHTTAAAYTALSTAEYLRPRPAPSDYLDTAVTPAPGSPALDPW